jgi:hypothetical protein
MGYRRVHFSISLTEEANRILERYCKVEDRGKSNMVEVMIKAYDKLHQGRM